MIDQALDPFLQALVDDARDQWTGDHDDRQVHRVGNVSNALVGLERVNVAGVGIDREDGAVELAEDQVVHQGKSQGVAIPRGPDHRD